MYKYRSVNTELFIFNEVMSVNYAVCLYKTLFTKQHK